MNIGKAVAICENLDSEKYSFEEKAFAIREVMNMPTHMGIRKDTLIGMIKWLWNFNLAVSESHNGKRIVEISTPHGRLIDADKLLTCLNALEYIAHAESGRPTFAEALEEIAKAPTIIEAEE